MTLIDIRPTDLDTVRRILSEHVPDIEVRAFGSRVSWNARETSDLDLALMTDDRLSIDCMAKLRAAFSKSPLPFRVDIVEWGRTSDDFRRIIEAQYALLQGNGNSLPFDWVRLVLADACSAINYGFTASATSDAVGPQFLRITDIVSEPINWKSVPFVIADDRTTEKYRLHHGDIVVARTGASTGASAYIQNPPCAVFASYLVRMKAKPDFSARFLSYVMKSGAFRDYIRGVLGDKSAQPNASAKTMTAVPIRAPRDKVEQRAIAHVLGALDDKIELNRRMNETLEGMARALFKSWFVDFDPVRAKMEGRDPGLPQDVADLFPDRMVDSEMGRIPEGWEPALLGDIVDMQGRGTDPGSVDSDTPYIGLADMPRGSITLARWSDAGSVTSRKFAFKAGQILFGKLRPYFHKVGIAPVDGLCSTDIVVLDAQDPKWRAFAMMCVSSSAFVAYASKTATGTKMPRTNWQTMTQYEVSRPTEAVAAAFQKAVSPMLQSVVGNIHESRTLAALRDTLLPKLVSGELRVPDAEALLESAL